MEVQRSARRDHGVGQADFRRRGRAARIDPGEPRFARGGKHYPNALRRLAIDIRSEEHTSELQSLMRISYAVFCLKKKKIQIQQIQPYHVSHTHPVDPPQISTTK